MGKRRIRSRIGAYADAFAPVVAGLDVKKEGRGVAFGITDFAKGAVRPSGSRVEFSAPRPELFQLVHRDRNAEVYRDLAQRVAKICKTEVRIAAGIADNDKAAAAAYHFVKTEVLEVTAVGQ